MKNTQLKKIFNNSLTASNKLISTFKASTDARIELDETSYTINKEIYLADDRLQKSLNRINNVQDFNDIIANQQHNTHLKNIGALPIPVIKSSKFEFQESHLFIDAGLGFFKYETSLNTIRMEYQLITKKTKPIEIYACIFDRQSFLDFNTKFKDLSNLCASKKEMFSFNDLNEMIHTNFLHNKIQWTKRTLSIGEINTYQHFAKTHYLVVYSPVEIKEQFNNILLEYKSFEPTFKKYCPHLFSIPNGPIILFDNQIEALQLLSKKTKGYKVIMEDTLLNKCCACLVDFDSTAKLCKFKCCSKHTMHLNCWINWCKGNLDKIDITCPLCRKPLCTPDSFKANLSLKNNDIQNLMNFFEFKQTFIDLPFLQNKNSDSTTAKNEVLKLLNRKRLRSKPQYAIHNSSINILANSNSSQEFDAPFQISVSPIRPIQNLEQIGNESPIHNSELIFLDSYHWEFIDQINDEMFSINEPYRNFNYRNVYRIYMNNENSNLFPFAFNRWNDARNHIVRLNLNLNRMILNLVLQSAERFWDYAISYIPDADIV